MTVKVQAYFDGSGKSHDPNVDCVALAGYVSTEDCWKEFESDFSVLATEHRIDYFHTSELAARRGAYRNLNPYQTALLFAAFILLLRKFNKRDFSAVLYSVSMSGYRTIERWLPTAEDICGSRALDDLCAAVPSEHELQVFYDRGESFFPRLQNMWRHEKRRRADPRLSRINVFSAVDDWRKYPALQAADLLAWYRAAGDGINLALLMKDLARYGEHYDKLKLESLLLPLPFDGTA
jgi:hypothetical protein